MFNSTIKRLSLLFILSALTFGSVLNAHEMSSNDNKVDVSGVGEVEVEPDVAVLQISVYAQKATLGEAKDEADTKYRSVLKVLSAYKIDDKHLKTTAVNAQPEYEWINRKQVLKGHRVSRSLTVKLVDMELLPEVMQDLVEKGVSTIDGVYTEVSNREDYVQQALGLAADDAKNKAAFLAKRLGRELGQVVFISEMSNQPSASQQPHYRMQVEKVAMASSAPAPQEHFGTEKIKVRITAHFALL